MSRNGEFPDHATDVMPGTQAVVPMRARPRVDWTDGAGAHAVTLDGGARVGSSAQAEIVVHDPTVSRLHAEFDVRDDGVWVRDLASRNGTHVEGIRVAAACVPDGGRVQLGATVLTVRTTVDAPAAVDLWPSDRFGRLVARSASMRALFARLARVAPTDATVLVHGETGTGKELIAQALHDHSPRAAGPFVVVDCAALPEGLIEAELFGHAKGAFTGAGDARAGSLEAAAGGTVFLDEVGELPLAVQPRLLRALESRTVRRLGETAHRYIDVRFVSATHRDLGAMVNAGAFREDLYFRLAVLPVTVPPLRERVEDIPVLVKHFLQGVAGAKPAPVDGELLMDLVARPWLGNVRELRNFVERVAVLGRAEALAMLRSPAEGARSTVPPSPPTTPRAGASVAADRPFREARDRCVESFERAYLEDLLARHGGNVAAAAQAADLDRTYVYKLLRRYGL